MNDRLTLKRTSPDHESWATLYDHPEHGQIDVGRISTRASLGNVADQWHWSIGIGSLPGLSHAVQGTAPTKDNAIDEWKHGWPAFRDARTEADWQEAAEMRDNSAKQRLHYDYLKVKGRIAADIQQRVERELAAFGPPPDWLTALIRGKSR